MEALNRTLQSLRHAGCSDAVLERVQRCVAESAPAQLVKMSPFRLAREWTLDRREVLDAFLLGTRAGLFDLEWDQRCPGCSGSTQLRDRLAGLVAESRCEYCELDFHGGFDENVEVTFRVNDGVRPLGDVDWKEVIAAQSVLEMIRPLEVPARGEATLEGELGPGTWHLFDETMALGVPMRLEGAPDPTVRAVVHHIRGTGEARSLVRGARPSAPGPIRLRVVNESDAPARLTLGRARAFPWVSGLDVASNQRFRDLFNRELISVAESFGIQNLSFVFTDVLGSTEMYERLGDARAFNLVKQHFDILSDVIARHRGAVVKTIGDAVMATFVDPGDALDAVLAMHAEFADFNATDLERDDIIIKVGLHRGPCIAVTSNERIDYFGRTVNLAARIQGLSQGGDIVLSTRCGFDADRGRGWQAQPFVAELKGIGSTEVLRLVAE